MRRKKPQSQSQKQVSDVSPLQSVVVTQSPSVSPSGQFAGSRNRARANNADNSSSPQAALPTSVPIQETTTDTTDEISSRLHEQTPGTAQATASNSPASAGKNGGGPSGHPSVVPESWDRWAEAVWENEKALVKAWQGDINYMLLFAGLFSTVLTSFIVPFYTYLQPQPPDTATQILMVVCAQLSLMSADTGHNLTQPAYCSDVYSSSDSPPSDVTVSTADLWFAALVCSLSAGSVAISVSQWLHRYMDQTSISSAQSIRLWVYRRQALDPWGVKTIISILPLLLQASLFLFLFGLVKLLRTYNHISAKLVEALALALLALSVLSALIPAFAPGCPYKSPQAWFFIRAVQQCRKPIHWIVERFVALTWKIYSRIEPPGGGWVQAVHSILDRLQTSQREWLKVQNWKDVDDLSMRVQQSREEDNGYSSDKRYCSILVEMDKVLMDDSFLECFVRPMIMERHLRAAVEAFYAIAQHRAHGRDASSNPPSLIWFPAEETNRGLEMMALMSLDLLSRIADDLMKDRETRQHSQTRVFDIVVHLLRAVSNTKLPVHGRLIALLENGDLHDTAFLQNVATVISTTEDNFEVDIECTRRLLACIPRLREQGNFENAVFMRISGTALLFSSKLRRTEQVEIIEIKEVMDAALQSIPAVRRARDVQWHSLARFLQSVEKAANLNISLFSDEIVESLESCVLSCPPADGSSSQIKHSMQELMKCKLRHEWSEPAELSDPRHLIARLEHSDFYDTTFLQRIADVISRNKDKFKVDIQCTRRLFACLPRLRELPSFDRAVFVRISGTALFFSSRLPRPLEEVDSDPVLI